MAGLVAERLADVATVAQGRPVPIAISLAHLALATPSVDQDTTALAHRLLATPVRTHRTGRLARAWRRLTARLRRRP